MTTTINREEYKHTIFTFKYMNAFINEFAE